MPRPRTPVETLKLTGQFRKDRHAGRESADAFAHGVPAIPDGLPADVAATWQQIVAALPTEAVCQIDAPLIEGMARWLTRWRKIMATIEAAGPDDNIAPLVRAAATCWKCFTDIASRFGLSPSDRAKLDMPKSAAGKLDKYIGGMPGQRRIYMGGSAIQSRDRTGVQKESRLAESE